MPRAQGLPSIATSTICGPPAAKACDSAPARSPGLAIRTPVIMTTAPWCVRLTDEHQAADGCGQLHNRLGLGEFIRVPARIDAERFAPEHLIESRLLIANRTSELGGLETTGDWGHGSVRAFRSSSEAGYLCFDSSGVSPDLSEIRFAEEKIGTVGWHLLQ